MQVRIVGAGIWGLACAHACALRGDQVTVYEAGRIGSGASGGIVGALSPHTPDHWNPKKQFQFEALETAGSFWRAVEARAGCSSGFGRIGRIQPLLSEKAVALARSRVATAAQHWQGRYAWSLQPRPAGLPEEAAPYGVVHDTLSGRILPHQALQALARACADLGVRLKENCPVTAVSDHCISGPWGRETADAVILAAGVGGFDLIAPFTRTLPGTGVKGQAALLQTSHRGDRPQLYADGLYIIPHADGTTAVGSTSENSWEHMETDAQLDQILTRARHLCPELAEAPILHRWSGLRPKARKRDPMLGPLPGTRGIHLALGAFKIGFGLAHKVGETLADTIHETPTNLPPSFTPTWHLN